MKLGVLIIPDDNAEIPTILNKLRDLGDVATVAAATDNKPTSAAAEPDLGVDIDEFSLGEETLPPRTLKDVKAILTRVRDEIDTKTLSEILTACGAKKLGELDESDYGACYAMAEEALKGNDAGAGDGDEFGFDDDDVPDVETIKNACKAYADTHGKVKATAILKAAGLNTVRGLKSASEEQLAQIWEAVAD